MSKKAAIFGIPIFLIAIVPLAISIFHDVSSVKESSEFMLGNKLNIDVLNLINKEREIAKVPTLGLEKRLSLVAVKKLSDQKTSSRDLMSVVGYKYKIAGDSIGFLNEDTKPEDVVMAFMQDAGSRKNILNAEYRDIGIASTKEMIVIEFGAEKQ